MTIQEQRRKAFEESFPLHEDIQWCGESIGYAPKSPSGAYSFVGLMAIAAMANGQLSAWNAALDSLVIEPVEQFGEPDPDSYDHRNSDPKYIADKAEFETNQARDALWIDAMEAAGLRGKQSPHGFRHMFSTEMNGRGYNRDWIERQLAHADPSVIRDTYNHATYLEQRRGMMQEWADLVDQADH